LWKNDEKRPNQPHGHRPPEKHGRAGHGGTPLNTLQGDTMKEILYACIIICLVGGNAYSLTEHELKILKDSVKEMCLFPDRSAEYLKVEGTAKAGLPVPVKIIKGELSGKIAYEKWKGIPVTLDKYKTDPRQCAQEMLKILVPAFKSTTKQPPPKKLKEPKISYGLISYPDKIAPGITFSGVTWREDYSRHSFTIQNDSSETPVTDVKVSLSIPAGFVSYKIQTNEGCQDAVLSQASNEGGLGSNGVIQKTTRYFVNDLTTSIARMAPRSRLSVFFIASYRGAGDDPFWCEIEYSYSDGKENHRRHFRYPVKVISETPFAIQIDQSKNMANQKVKATLRMMPENPLVFSPNGSVEEHKEWPSTAPPRPYVQPGSTTGH
jgi:hypothetical protein